MGSWHEQIVSGKLPTCPEVCKDCMSGKHIFHMLGELSDLYAEWEPRIVKRRATQRLVLYGWAEDELFLEQLLEFIGAEYNQHKTKTNSKSSIDNKNGV